MNRVIRKSRPSHHCPSWKCRRVTDLKINSLLFLTYRGTAQTELLPRDSRQGNHHKRQKEGGGVVWCWGGREEGGAEWKDATDILSSTVY